MRLGGTVSGNFSGPEEWERLLVKSRFRAVTAPFNCDTPESETDAYRAACERHDVLIAEVGVWNNVFDPDPARAAAAVEYAVKQLKLADRTGVRCCVNIAGTAGTAGWDAADRSNFTDETYERIIRSVREIIDRAEPKYAFYTLEPMPWMIPDSPDVYLQLIRDVNRPQFGAHMDFVNMINCPRRYLAPEKFISECFTKLGPMIRRHPPEGQPDGSEQADGDAGRMLAGRGEPGFREGPEDPGRAAARGSAGAAGAHDDLRRVRKGLQLCRGGRRGERNRHLRSIHNS
uniref:Xylose isomerase domain-containing protein n=1 Tax=uncultured bacterium Contig1588_n_1603_cl TaxID=1393463 RepID=W0FTK7_9BACT|nr:xylose isomerase domain-containing protein [uncultured bacterium Contig1588_n_1603_cl]